MCLLGEQKQKPYVTSEVQVLKRPITRRTIQKSSMSCISHIPYSHMKCNDTHHQALLQGVFQKRKEGSMQWGSPHPTSEAIIISPTEG